MGMLVIKSYGNYLCEGSQDDRKRNGFYCPHFGQLLGARLFESERQMLKWLKDETNLPPWRLDREYVGWALVPYNEEAAALITRLVERMS